MKALLLILGVFVGSTFAVLCPKNRLEFFSHFSLGKQDELNRTFDSIAKNLTFPEVVFNATDNARYRIGDYNITWRYVDTNQKANVSRQDTVIVYGGHLRVDVNFNWNLVGSASRNGTGTATARTETIQFSKNLTIDEKSGFVMWNLVHHLGVALDENKVVLQRLNPSNEDDSNNVTKMLNHLTNNSGFADLFQQGVNTVLDINLNDSLHEEHFQQQRFLNYTFNHPIKGPITVEYDVVIGSAIIESNGLHIFSSDTIKNYSDFVCGNPVPDEPRDVQHFGGLQTFLSQGFIESTAKYALNNGIFDTDLNEDAWESRHFQFFAGDLYDVIPALQKRFYPSNKLNGNCKALKDGFSIGRGSSETFNVTINYDCSLNAENSGKILDFSVASHLVLKGVAQTRHIDLLVTHAEFNATYHGYGQYQVTNTALADYYLNGTTWTLRNTKVFGSNFSMIARDYPHFQIHKDGYATVYDSSQIGRILQTE